MSLPVTLEPGYCSIVLGVSPNGVTSENSLISEGGTVDAIIDTGNNLVSIGQFVWFKKKDTQQVFTYSNERFFIVKEEDVLFIENPPV